MKQKLYLVFLLSLCFFSGELQAQTPGQRYLRKPIEQTPFEEPVWVEAKKGLDYSPRNPQKTEKKGESEQNQRQELNDRIDEPHNPAIDVDQTLGVIMVKFLIILSAAIAIALLLRQFLGFGGLPRNVRIKESVFQEGEFKNIEENLHETELEEYIQKAIKQQRYNVAIRLYFLAILKELSLNQSIYWKKNKTNREYLQELQRRVDYNDFKKTTLIFERVWYGNRMINIREFHEIKDPFERFLQRLQAEKINYE